MTLPRSSKHLSQEYRIYLALWRKAETQRETDLPPVTLRASSKSVAASIRSGMYKAIRPYRNGQAHDETLRLAAENFVVSSTTNPDGTCSIVLKPRLSISELELQLEALGLSEDDLRLPEEKTADEMLLQLLEPKPEPSAQPSRSTPFYTRED